MAKNIIIWVLVALVVVLTFGTVIVKSERDRLQNHIDQTFAASYHNLTLNMLNETIEGIGQDAKHKYAVENTKHSYNLTQLFQYTTYNKLDNADLNYIVGVLAQSSGYGAISQVNMEKELYELLREVPNNGFGNKEAIHAAKEALESALLG